MKRKSRKSPLEDVIFVVFRPPIILMYVFIVLIVGSLIFHFDFINWWIKACNFFYLDKVIKFMSTVLMAVIPK